MVVVETPKGWAIRQIIFIELTGPKDTCSVGWG